MSKEIEANCNSNDSLSIKNGANIILSGGLVVFPTETVFGLGADATSDIACRKIFEAKGRPQDNPLIVHFHSIVQLKQYCYWDDVSHGKELEKLWPGPLTVIVRKKDNICNTASAGLDTIGVRIPDCAFSRKLLEEVGRPIAAPSANRSGMPSGTSIDQIREELGNQVDLMFSGEIPKYGIESTVIKVVGEKCLILRPGAYTKEDLLKIFPSVEFSKIGKTIISPGTKYRHYAPKKPLLRTTRDNIKNVFDRNEDFIPILTDQTAMELERNYISLGNREDPYDISRHLYSALRQLDSNDARGGIIETFQNQGYYSSIMNRIEKASVEA